MVVDVELPGDDLLEERAHIRHADFGEAIRFQDVDEPREHLFHIMREVVFQIVGVVHGVELTGLKGAQVPGIQANIRIAFGVNVQEEMIPSFVKVGDRRLLAAAADVQEPAPYFASAVLQTIYQLGIGGAIALEQRLPSLTVTAAPDAARRKGMAGPAPMAGRRRT